ncbi:MAG: hypothetical protein V7756_07340 [Halopseudomonas sp.]|uniref:hypothetical protein n=1 Tax=Halopseudomonas sp. TaxID=2901191 RepID=UPI003002F209
MDTKPKAMRADLSGLRLANYYFAHHLMPGAHSTIVLDRLMAEAEASEVGGDAISELRLIANHIRESGVMLPAEENQDACDLSLGLVLQLIEDRIAALDDRSPRSSGGHES